MIAQANLQLGLAEAVRTIVRVNKTAPTDVLNVDLDSIRFGELYPIAGQQKL